MEPSVLIEYSLDENDIVLYQLFAASQSDRIKKKRSRSKVVYPIIFLSIAVVPFLFRDYTAVSILAISSVLWYFMYPTWEKKRYEKHYREFVQENWKNKLNKKMKVEFKQGQTYA